MKKTLKRILYYAIGSLTLSLGIAFSVLSKLGAGSFDAMNYNLSELIDVEIGKAMMLSVLFIFVLTLVIKPRFIYILGFLLSYLVSLQLNWFTSIFPVVEESIPWRLFYLGLGILLIPLGVSFIIKSKFPLSPMDNLMVILTEKTKWPISVVKTLIEGSYAVIALFFGYFAGIGMGGLSIGTLIITFSVGPGIGLFLKYIKDIE